MAPSASSRRCRDVAAVGGIPNGRWTWPVPPLPPQRRHRADSKTAVSATPDPYLTLIQYRRYFAGIRAGGRRDCHRAQPAGPDVFSRRRQGIEHDLNLPTDEVGQRWFRAAISPAVTRSLRVLLPTSTGPRKRYRHGHLSGRAAGKTIAIAPRVHSQCCSVCALLANTFSGELLAHRLTHQKSGLSVCGIG
jgi:hypothetical protein